ncbi:MAG: hypothetical protein U1A27_08920 [Phycisphaerae bacterium]
MLPRDRRALGCAVAAAAVFLACFGIEVLALREWRAPTLAAWAQVCLGDTADAVVAKLGRPLRDIAAAEAPADYYLSGYGCKRRPITGRVMLYSKADLVLYVWFDRAGRVEDTFMASS